MGRLSMHSKRRIFCRRDSANIIGLFLRMMGKPVNIDPLFSF